MERQAGHHALPRSSRTQGASDSRLSPRPQIYPSRDDESYKVVARPRSWRVARILEDYTASTATTPGTALMAPAICGETLKRPGSLTSTSVPSFSSNMIATSPLSRSEEHTSELQSLRHLVCR